MTTLENTDACGNVHAVAMKAHGGEDL